MTERLYYTDSHLTDFTARVTNIASTADNRTAVTLDRTAFYPTGGGQPFDTGTLNDYRVVECISDDDGDEVQHVLDGECGGLFSVGTNVTGQVDWSRRLDHIQQHTAQHILSRAFFNLYDAPTGGFRMLGTYSEVDIKLDRPTDERIQEALTLANNIVWENRPVHVRFMAAEEAAERGVRQRFERAGTLRVVEIEGFDLNPCGGTHARHTGEVGVIFITNWERAKGMARLTVVAGKRALDDYTLANRTARDAAALFSVSRDETAHSVARLIESHTQLMRRARELDEKAVSAEADEIITNTPLSADGVRVIHRVFAERDAALLKLLAQKLIRYPRTVALLGASDGEKAHLVFARAEDAPGDMSDLLRQTCPLINGRGGGRPDMAQGGGTTVGTNLHDAVANAAHGFSTSGRT